MTQAQAQEMLTRYGALVWSLSRRLAGEDAEELFQETFLRLMSAAVPPEEVQARNLLYTICLNLYRSAYRRRKHRAAYAGPMPQEAPAPEDTPSDAQRAIIRGIVRGAVDTLPEKQRVPIVLHYFAGWSTARIAQHLGRKESTLRSDMRRAREKLKNMLGEWM